LQKEKEDAKELKDLRDLAVITFFMVNALFVLVIFVLELHNEVLHIKWRFGVTDEVCTLYTN